MENIGELDNVVDASNFLNRHGITGNNMLSQGLRDEKDLIVMKLLDLERKGFVKFEKGLGYEIINYDISCLLKSDKLILENIQDGIVCLENEGKIRKLILEELYEDNYINNMEINEEKTIRNVINNFFIKGLIGFNIVMVILILCFSFILGIVAIPFGYFSYKIAKDYIKEGKCKNQIYNLSDKGIALINKLDALDEYNRLDVNTKNLEIFKKYIKYKNKM